MYVCEDDAETQIMKNRDIRKMHPILGLSCINLVVKTIVVRGTGAVRRVGSSPTMPTTG